MSKNEYTRIIKEIKTLPTGGITYKKINGKKYSKDSADVVLERMKIDQQVKKSFKDMNINIKDGKKEIQIKTN